jgi:pantoate--beta-alanine ligase
MEIFNFIGDARQWLERHHKTGRKEGFVPTMGALHEGHISLIKRAREENDIVGCSIFVNPIQFNNPEDLEKYPRTLEKDLAMLKTAGCDLVLTPSVKEMYPEPVVENFDFGDIERVMEGKFRPGHFNGVAVVVKRLFDIFRPDRAYFGEKDFQQLRIIQRLVEMEKIPVEIVPCKTLREADGLAMSSRNRRLSAEERKIAPRLFQTMMEVKDQYGRKEIGELINLAKDRLTKSGFIIDYVEIASVDDLQPLRDRKGKVPARIFMACFLGNVRLIDNLEIIS